MRSVEFVGWFSAGCGFALLAMVGGHMALSHAMTFGVASEDAGHSDAAHVLAPSELAAVSPRPDRSEVPIQRPQGRRTAAGPSTASSTGAAGDVSDASHGELWNPDDARLPQGAERSRRWNPDDARLPPLAFMAALVPRVRWNPDRATLPSVKTRPWDPDDARLPSSL